MDKAKMQNQIQQVADKIAREFQPEKIILFGSWAWGDPGPDSDVDLFIIKDTENRRETVRAIDSSLWQRRFPMDIIVHTPESVERSIGIGNFFVRDIITKGKVLYAR